MFQLILNPISDWNKYGRTIYHENQQFQLILNPIRDWNFGSPGIDKLVARVPINLKPY